MDINGLLEDKDNGLVPLDGRSYGIAAYAGQLRQARDILLGSLPAETVACMSDNEVLQTLVGCKQPVPAAASCKDGINDEVIFLVPAEILKRCRVLQR